jgi:hypothetical protein
LRAATDTPRGIEGAVSGPAPHERLVDISPSARPSLARTRYSKCLFKERLSLAAPRVRSALGVVYSVTRGCGFLDYDYSAAFRVARLMFPS